MHEVTEMARKRNRLVTAREPNGRIQREKKYSPTEIRRLRDASIRGMRDPEWGSELGRLYLEGCITDSMCGAGKRWRDEAAQYRSSIGAFPIRTTSLERGVKSHPPDVDSEDGREQAIRDTNAAERFFEAHAVLVSAGMGAENAVVRLCEEDCSLAGMQELKNARCGLIRLAEHYRLTAGGKSDSASDRHG